MKNLFYKISNFSIRQLPQSVRLGLKVKLNTLAKREDPELKYLAKITKGRRIAIDAGCNIGVYSYKLSKLFKKVYAFDVNPRITSDLTACNPGNISVMHSGLSNKSGTGKIYIPLHENGFELDGWISLNKDNCHIAQSMAEREISLITLDSLKLSDVDFIKVDVEGHEFEFLQGAMMTIEQSRPVVLIEVKPANVEKVEAFFKQLDYLRVSLRQIAGVDGSDENLIFIPNNRGNT